MRKRQSQKSTVAPENPVAIDLLEPKPNIAPLSLSQTPPRRYSCTSATTGSTAIARLAGTWQASRATTINTTAFCGSNRTEFHLIPDWFSWPTNEFRPSMTVNREKQMSSGRR